MNNLTIFTDASFCSESKAAAGAFWARNESERWCGSFPLKVTKSHEAEIAAAIKSVATIYRDRSKLIGKQRIILVTDCLSVKQAIEHDNVFMPEDIQKVMRRLLDAIYNNGDEIKVNHVKAHSGTKRPRNWVNNWCDNAAKTLMRKIRSEEQCK